MAMAVAGARTLPRLRPRRSALLVPGVFGRRCGLRRQLWCSCGEPLEDCLALWQRPCKLVAAVAPALPHLPSRRAELLAPGVFGRRRGLRRRRSCGLGVGPEPIGRRELRSTVGGEPANSCSISRTSRSVGVGPLPSPGRGRLLDAEVVAAPHCCASAHRSITLQFPFGMDVVIRVPGCCRELQCLSAFRAKLLPRCRASHACSGRWSE
mmetsp:Transcript_111062/g.324875  ORF Transcript_111062/g.324875 Transcript_111062/m.324875 type:complete len:209 (-) Transcript_111062:590-1216(-)